MQVITFYSYKGGVGRTLACANFGLYLAKTGQKVVLADMDLEAPGLDSKFPNVDLDGLPGGLLDQFTSFQDGLEIPDLTAVEIPLPEDVAQAGGRLQLIPAGNYLTPEYYPKLSALRWKTLLSDESGLAFCIDLVRRIEEKFRADILVIDSRTGLTEVGGLCTQILPDTVILLTSTSRESLRGTERICECIRNSPIVKHRIRARTEVDVRIVVARIPRPDDLAEFERAFRQRLDVPVERFYYLFDQRDLCLEEYLALDRFDEHPAILDDYVELFASLNPEIMLPYIEDRLTSFRSQLTRRPVQENERIIQELLMLFPRPDVVLEAAHYYRLAKDGDAKAVANYLRYLDCRPNDSEALREFAELCGAVSERELKPQERIAFHLKAFGADRMDANLLARFLRLSDAGGLQEIVSAVEKDDAKMADEAFRATYFRALHTLGEWEKIVASASDRELRSRPLALLVAEAFGHVGRHQKVLEIMGDYGPRGPDDALGLLRVLFTIMPDADRNAVEQVFGGSGRLIEYVLGGPGWPGRIEGESRDFVRWLETLRRQYHAREK